MNLRRGGSQCNSSRQAAWCKRGRESNGIGCLSGTLRLCMAKLGIMIPSPVAPSCARVPGKSRTTEAAAWVPNGRLPRAAGGFANEGQGRVACSPRHRTRARALPISLFGFPQFIQTLTHAGPVPNFDLDLPRCHPNTRSALNLTLSIPLTIPS